MGEGQFGDVHRGTMVTLALPYVNWAGKILARAQDGREVAVKTCKESASSEEMSKFLEEASKSASFATQAMERIFFVS